MIDDITTTTWFTYIWQTMMGYLILSLSIIIFTMSALVILIGKLWGKSWNRAWKLQGNRLWGVLILSFIAAFSLAGVHRMYGGSFDTSVASTIKALPDLTVSELKDENPKVLSMIYQIIQIASHSNKYITESAGNRWIHRLHHNTIEQFTSSYQNTLTTLWVLFTLSQILLIGGVAWYAYKDIRVIEN